MIRLITLVRLEIRRQILGWSGAWWFIIALVLGQAVTPLLGLFVWTQVPGSGSGVGPYYLAVLCVALVTASFENHTFAQSIYSGDIVPSLVRPQPIVIVPLGENLAIRMWMIVLGIPLVAAVILSLDIRYEFAVVVSALPAVVIASVLRFLFVWTLAMAAFWTERVHAVVGFGTVLIFLLGGSAAPVSVLPGPMRTLAMWLPFRSMLGFPAELAAGELPPTSALSGYAVALGWTAILAIAAVYALRAGVRRYSSVGA